jgi:hypothetical protein
MPARACSRELIALSMSRVYFGLPLYTHHDGSGDSPGGASWNSIGSGAGVPSHTYNDVNGAMGMLRTTMNAAQMSRKKLIVFAVIFGVGIFFLNT